MWFFTTDFELFFRELYRSCKVSQHISVINTANGSEKQLRLGPFCFVKTDLQEFQSNNAAAWNQHWLPYRCKAADQLIFNLHFTACQLLPLRIVIKSIILSAKRYVFCTSLIVDDDVIMNQILYAFICANFIPTAYHCLALFPVPLCLLCISVYFSLCFPMYVSNRYTR